MCTFTRQATPTSSPTTPRGSRPSWPGLAAIPLPAQSPASSLSQPGHTTTALNAGWARPAWWFQPYSELGLARWPVIVALSVQAFLAVFIAVRLTRPLPDRTAHLPSLLATIAGKHSGVGMAGRRHSARYVARAAGGSLYDMPDTR